jgi:hypothetical protein
MSALDTGALQVLLDTLAAVDASLQELPAELPPPPARRRPARLRRDGTE